HTVANNTLLRLRMANCRRRPAVAVAVPRRHAPAPSHPDSPKWTADGLIRSSIAVRAHIHPFIIRSELPPSMKRLIVLRKRKYRPAGAIGIIGTAVRHSKIGSLPFLRQIGQLHNQIIAPPLLEPLLLLLQLILSDRAVTIEPLRWSVLSQRHRNQQQRNTGFHVARPPKA